MREERYTRGIDLEIDFDPSLEMEAWELIKLLREAIKPLCGRIRKITIRRSTFRF